MGGLDPMEMLQGLAGFNTDPVDSIGCFSKNPSPIREIFFFFSLSLCSVLLHTSKLRKELAFIFGNASSIARSGEKESKPHLR